MLLLLTLLLDYLDLSPFNMLDWPDLFRLLRLKLMFVVDLGWSDWSFETPTAIPDIVTVWNGLFLLREGLELSLLLELLSRNRKGSLDAESTDSRARQLDSLFWSRISDARLACSDVKLGVIILPSACLTSNELWWLWWTPLSIGNYWAVSFSNCST